MAQGMFDWNMKDPNTLREEYVQSVLGAAPSRGSRFGAEIGTSLGRLFGGKAPMEAEQELIKNVFTQAAKTTTDPMERMKVAAQGFREIGMEGRAMQLEEQMAKMGEIQARTQEAQAKGAEATNKFEAAQQALIGRTQFVKRKLPELTEPEARALASDPEAVRKLIETSKEDTVLTEANGRRLLIKKSTGELVADLGSAASTGTKVEVKVNPEIKMAPDIVGAINAFDKATEADQNMLSSAQRAQSFIKESMGSQNSQTWEAARTTVAKAVGQDKLSNEDIRRTGVDPRLVQGAADWINKKVVGVPTPEIQRQLYVLAKALEQDAAKRINSKASRTREAAKASNFTGNPDVYFPSANTGSSGAGGVVDWNALPNK